MYDRLEYRSGEELCERMASECDTAIVALAAGKTDRRMAAKCGRYFKRIVPYYCYLRAGAGICGEVAEYYEEFFGCHIYRLPHRAFYRWLRTYTFQPPERVTKIEALDIPGDEYDDAMIGEIVRSMAHLPEGAYTGNGVRAADSPMRRIGISSHGAINHNTRLSPGVRLEQGRLLAKLRESGVRLPID